MNKFLKNYFLLFAIFTFANAHAQVNDAGLWLGVSAEKKFSTKLAAQLTEEFRFYENVTELGTVFTELSVDYKIAKGLSAGAHYRFTQKRRVNDFYSLRHRYGFELSYKFKIKKLVVMTRGRFQSLHKQANTSENSIVPENYLRSKFTLKYDTDKKMVPFASTEFFNRLNDESGEAFVDNVRYQFGFDYELNKFSSFTLSYIIDKEVNVKNPWTSYISNISYKYSF